MEQCLLESNLDETLSTVQVVTDLNGPQKVIMNNSILLKDSLT